MLKMKGYRKIITILFISLCITALGFAGKMDGGNLTAVFCTAIAAFNYANSKEYK